MKIDFIYTLLAIAIAAELSWGVWTIEATESLKLVAAITTFLTLSIAGTCALAVKANGMRSVIVMRATAAAFFFVLLLLNGAFSFFEFSIPLYVILNALALLIMITVCRAVVKTKQ